jgi:hypothetical protein
MVSAVLEVLGPCCFDVEDTSSSRRCPPMKMQELSCW